MSEQTLDQPRPTYLTGHLAPVPDEIDAVDLPVTGALPSGLTGRYFRNGPNPLPGEDPGHWFSGHGMLHGIRLREGRAEWYRNRWVRTSLLAGAQTGQYGPRDLAMHPANTHVIEHAGRLLALCEGGLPYQVTPDLAPVGPQDFGGRLTTAMTAHPKQDPRTGELHFFGYGTQPPYVTYHRLSANGELERSVPIEVPGPTMMHDFAITEHNVVWLDLPVVFDLSRVGKGMPFQWDDGYGARLGVMPKDSPGRVRWFDIDPCYVFHVGNAREDAQGRIILDAVRYAATDFVTSWAHIGGPANPAGPAAAVGQSGAAVLYRWTLDPVTGAVREKLLDDRTVEFPTLNETLVGLEHRYIYSVGAGDANGVVKHDTVTTSSQAHELGPDVMAGEAVFVPAEDADAEDAGWLLTITTNRAGTASELLVLDATDVAGGPVATVRLPRGVPAGFHGSWIPDE